MLEFKNKLSPKKTQGKKIIADPKLKPASPVSPKKDKENIIVAP